MKLCIFAGTFNPIHRAHLKMAQYVSDNYDFDKILFIPACKPPHKDYDRDMCEHRFNMVKLAVQSDPKFEVSDIEYKREGKSYTYCTVLELYEKFEIEGKISFIIGQDAYEKIDTWYEAEKLKSLLEFIVFPREAQDISSSELRKRIKQNKPVDDIVTKEVEDYIIENGLYRD